MQTVSYERISEDKTGEQAGVDRQHRDNALMAQAKGRKIEKRYVDNSISALDESKVRPEFEKLVYDVAAGRVGLIIVWHIDRLAVRMSDLARLLEAARPHEVQIASVHGFSVDLGDPTGVAVAQILTAIAEMERRHKGARQKAANRQRAEHGNVGWTRRPFGFDRVDGEIIVDAVEAEEIRAMAKAALRGDTLSSIAADLNEREVGTSVGGRWSVTTVRRVLLNPRINGRAVSNGKDFGAATWPQVLSDETYERLTTLLRDPRRRTAPSTHVKHLLSGLAICGRCGARMFASPTTYRRKGTTYLVYRCAEGKGHLTRKLEPVDELVEAVIVERLSRPDAAQLFAPDADLDGLRSTATDLRQRRDAIAAMLADDLISAEAARDQAGRLTERLYEVEREIETASGTGPLAVFVDSDDVKATWDGLDLMTKRSVIDTLATITINPQGKGASFDPESIAIEPRA